MAASSFKPLLTANQPGGSPIVDRNLQAVKSALDRVAQESQDAINKVAGKAVVAKLTSKDGSVIVSPTAGVGEVDLSVFDDGTDPGTIPLALGEVGPLGLTSATPTTFFKIVKDGVTWMIPAWRWTPPSPSGMPLAGLVGWWKGDAGVTLSGSNVTAWADQSGNSYDLAFESSSPLYVTGGTVPYIDFNTGVSAALSSSSLPWGTSYSVLIVAKRALSASNGRLIDFHYSTANRYIWARSSGTYFYEDDDHVKSTDGLDTSSLTYILVTVTPVTAAFYQDTGTTPSLAVPVSSVASGSPGATAGIRVGGLPAFGQNSNCQVWEAATWDHELNSTERTQLASYLASRSY